MWLIDRFSADDFVSAKRAGLRPSPDELRAFNEHVSLRSVRGESGALTVSGASSEIRIDGVLTARPDIFAVLFGGGNTTYADLQAAISEARESDAIKRVTVMVDSPGGQVSGLYETMEAFAALRAEKKVEVIATNAHSAAYALAAAAGPIRAKNEASSVGSVGAVMAFRLDEDIVEVTNTDSPDKRPDVGTEEGKAVIRSYLDSVHEVIARKIAEGREVPIDTVLKDYGRGASMMAREAHRLGMIDGIARPVGAAPSSVRAEKKQDAPSAERKEPAMEKMDLRTLQEQHPSAFEAAVALGRKEGAEQGVKQERGRVSALLKMADAAEGEDARKLAHSAIADGREVDGNIQSEFFAAAMAHTRRAQHASESNAVRGTLSGSSTPHAKENAPLSPHEERARAFRASFGIGEEG